MKSLECMTVGLSLTDNDVHLLKYASMLAFLKIVKRFQFVHVLAEEHASGVGVDRSDALRQMRVNVDRQFGSQANHVTSSFDVRVGSRIDEMLAFVTQNPSGAVLVGHGRTSSGKRSLATRLAMTCPTNVWMVPDQSACQIRGVLAPVDFSLHSADSMSLAAAITKQAGLSECQALHVYFDTDDEHYAETQATNRQKVSEEFSQFLRPLDLHDVKIKKLIEEENNVSKAICRIAIESQCDLIVMSTRGRSRAAAVLLGSETLQTLTESQVPVLAVKHRGAFLNFLQALQDQKLWSQAGPKSN